MSRIRLDMFIQELLILPAAVFESPSFEYSDGIARSLFDQVCSLWQFVMVTLWNRADHYIFILCFLSFFSSPNLGCRTLDVYHTSTHGVAFVRI